MRIPTAEIDEETLRAIREDIQAQARTPVGKIPKHVLSTERREDLPKKIPAPVAVPPPVPRKIPKRL